MFSLEMGILDEVRAVMLPLLELAKRILKVMVQFTQVMENRGRQLIEKLMALDCSAYRIYHQERIASPTTVKAWYKGWWNPNGRHLDKLEELEIKIKRELRGKV